MMNEMDDTPLLCGFLYAYVSQAKYTIEFVLHLYHRKSLFF
jgi:hypothetical protein